MRSWAAVNTMLRTLAPVRLCRLVGIALVLTLTVARASERWAVLEAIHAIENPRNLTRPGPFGELGAYQFREVTWRMHTNLPFQLALERDKSDAIAVAHYEWLKHGLERAGLAATPYNIALAWNGGLDAAIRGVSPASTRNYARRAANLAGAFNQAPPQLVASAQ